MQPTSASVTKTQPRPHHKAKGCMCLRLPGNDLRTLLATVQVAQASQGQGTPGAPDEDSRKPGTEWIPPLSLQTENRKKQIGQKMLLDLGCAQGRTGPPERQGKVHNPEDVTQVDPGRVPAATSLSFLPFPACVPSSTSFPL